MDQQVGVGYINCDGIESSYTDICLAWMHDQKFAFIGMKSLWIDLYETVDIEKPGAKSDYYQCLSLAFNCFGMQKVFKDFIFPNYPHNRLKIVHKLSWETGRLYISPEIPYLLFLMLVTIIRYSGEKRKGLQSFNQVLSKILENGKLTYKQKAKLFCLCDTLGFSSSPFIKNFATGHSLTSFRQLGENGERLKSIDTIHRRINKYINNNKHQGIVHGVTEKDSLHRLIIPGNLSRDQFLVHGNSVLSFDRTVNFFEGIIRK